MSRIKSTYEQFRPLVIWLGIVELIWIAWWLLQPETHPASFRFLVIGWIMSMVFWVAFVIYTGKRDLFLRHTRLFSNLAGLIFVLTLSAFFFASSNAGRTGVLTSAVSAGEIQLIAFHTFRLLAVGTVIKYLHGELPRHFLIWGSLPDLLFAVSAVIVTCFTTTGMLDRNLLIGWHITGILVFFGAGISMFFSVPSPLQIYRDAQPDASIVFRYPMLLAPNFTVPLFVIAHCLALVKLLA